MKDDTQTLEMAVLEVRDNEMKNFEAAFAEAQGIIASMPGYISHSLHHCVESANRYLLLVEWKSLAAHTVGFRESAEYTEWKRLLHHFYNPFPTVEHYHRIF